MALYGKTPSAKRSKPSYAYAIVGVALVLFLFGIVGWLFLNLKKSSEIFRENIQLHAWIAPSASKKQIDSLEKFISSQPFVKKAEYVTKEKAVAKWNAENDSSWKKFITNNPLPESVDFYVKAEYMEKDSLIQLGQILESNFAGIVSEFQYHKETITNVSSLTKYVASFILIVAIILSIIVIISIDNTIRLAMYSNRFLIKTMQMVGATRSFIARPLNVRAIINGLIAAGIAIAAVFAVIILVEKFVPWIKLLRDTSNMFIIIIGIIILGVSISWFSTQRSVLKYLKMKLDDLY
ncbi:MAG TPA: permease-like cell division protein FtsX [Ferruginibacter sp.]|nr:permease-like cell division protein FtsX [Ferruginibacter sp.]HMP20877.1 permease-like cell division protein FtsX [Ferruginibacter sp.]